MKFRNLISYSILCSQWDSLRRGTQSPTDALWFLEQNRSHWQKYYKLDICLMQDGFYTLSQCTGVKLMKGVPFFCKGPEG